MRSVGVFARKPEPGKVKTRLSPALPAELSCDLYRAMLGDTLEAAAHSSADQRVIYWTGSGEDKTESDPRFETRRQRGRHLGERLANAFSELLTSDRDRAVIIGADCPELEPHEIDRAFELLESTDLVLGPSQDGGYYLIGLRRPSPSIFRDIPWSTAEVLVRTLERARQVSISTATLEAKSDLDTPDDLARWIARAVLRPGLPGAQTAAALRRMGLLPT
jgi:hypothetical protein